MNIFDESARILPPNKSNKFSPWIVLDAEHILSSPFPSLTPRLTYANPSECHVIRIVYSLLYSYRSIEPRNTEVGIYERKQENTLSTKKAIKKKKKKKHALDPESDQEK